MKQHPYTDASILFRIKRTDYFFRYLFLGWVAFAVYKFNVNPFFFSVTIVFAILFVIAISDQTVNLKSDCIEIKSKSWLPIISTEETWLISEIKVAHHYIREPGELVYVLNVIKYVPGTTRRMDKIIIEFKNEREPYEITLGTLKEKKQFTEILQSRIQALSKH